jgi:hypothetical protein
MPTLKTLGDAIYLSNDLIARLEQAAVETDPCDGSGCSMSW